MTSDNSIGSIAEAISEEADPEKSLETRPEEKWPSALATLASARLAIISEESGHAAGVYGKKIALGALVGICVVTFWIFLLVGIIGIVPIYSGLAWYHVAFIVAGLHLLIVFGAILLLKEKTAAVFSITKSEFSKDKLWLSSVKQESTFRS